MLFTSLGGAYWENCALCLEKIIAEKAGKSITKHLQRGNKSTQLKTCTAAPWFAGAFNALQQAYSWKWVAYYCLLIASHLHLSAPTPSLPLAICTVHVHSKFFSFPTDFISAMMPRGCISWGCLVTDCNQLECLPVSPTLIQKPTPKFIDWQWVKYLWNHWQAATLHRLDCFLFGKIMRTKMKGLKFT